MVSDTDFFSKCRPCLLVRAVCGLQTLVMVDLLQQCAKWRQFWIFSRSHFPDDNHYLYESVTICQFHIISPIESKALLLNSGMFLWSHYQQSATAVSLTLNGFVYQVMYLQTFRCIISEKCRSYEPFNGINALIKCGAKKFTVGINPGCYRRKEEKIVFSIWQTLWLWPSKLFTSSLDLFVFKAWMTNGNHLSFAVMFQLEYPASCCAAVTSFRSSFPFFPAAWTQDYVRCLILCWIPGWCPDVSDSHCSLVFCFQSQVARVSLTA